MQESELAVTPNFESCKERNWESPNLACETRQAVLVDTMTTRVTIHRERAIEVLLSTANGDVQTGVVYQVLEIEQ